MRRVVLDQSCTDAQGRLKGPMMVGHELPDESHVPSSECWCSPPSRTEGYYTVYKHTEKE